MKVEVAVLGSPSLTVLTVSVDVKQHLRTELRSCVTVEVAVPGSLSLTVLTVSVDVKQHLKEEEEAATCKSRKDRFHQNNRFLKLLLRWWGGNSPVQSNLSYFGNLLFQQ